MTEQERKPTIGEKRIHRTIKRGEPWNLEGVLVRSITVDGKEDHGGSFRVTATVIDNPSTID
jgi:hypothetical protein